MTRRDSGFKLPIRVLYQPPGCLFVYSTVLHSVSLLCLYPADVPLWSKYMLAVVIFSSYGAYIWKYHKARRNPVEVILQSDGDWRLVVPERGERQEFRMNLLPGAFIHPILVVITLKGETGRFSFIFTPGNVNAAVLRRLRVRLRHQE